MSAAAAVTVADRPLLIVAEWEKNGHEIVRVALDQFNGRNTVNARIWYRNGDEFKPGKSGLTLGLKHLPALADAMAKALAKARERGLLDATPDNIISRDGGER